MTRNGDEQEMSGNTMVTKKSRKTQNSLGRRGMVSKQQRVQYMKLLHTNVVKLRKRQKGTNQLFGRATLCWSKVTYAG